MPQSWAVIIAVAVFHVVYTWNLYFEPLLYLSSKPDLQPIATGLAQFNSIYSEQIRARSRPATLMTIVIPMIVFFMAQRCFMRGIVDHRGGEMSEADAGGAHLRRRAPGSPERRRYHAADPGDAGRCWRRGRRSSSRAAGRRHSRSWRARSPMPGTWSATTPSTTRGCRVLNGDGLATDVRSAEEVIRSVTGHDPRPWFRAPFGSGADRADLVDALQGLGYRHIGWHIESNEWEPGRTADQIHRSVVDGALAHGDGAIALLHTWPRPVAPALPRILADLGAQGAALRRRRPARPADRAWSRSASRDRRTSAPRRDATARRGAGGRRRQLEG